KEKKMGRIRRYINFYKYLFNILPQSDTVFIHMIPAWVILAWPVAFIFRKKIYLWYTHKSATFSLRFAEKLVARIFTASPESCRLNSKKIIVTGHGIDTEHFKPKDIPKDSNTIKLLTAGRTTFSKDYEFLINAIEIVIKKGHRAVLNIAGAPATPTDFVYKKKLDNLIGQKNLGKNINFLGAKTYAEMPDIYNNHDVLLHASETGSLDKAVLEAMACGLLILTTSEAFIGTLNVLPKEANLMAEKIIQLKNAGKDLPVRQAGLSLREIIIQNHNLTNLIGKVLENIKI
ncbi:MAG: glycosyltransferase family 4 protein, partial [Candidatus Giovannonibacteria bacterium]|nr:glycosyltransferase family 4 protein [Candidatus Giovannonibacteria bacterium]